MLNVKAHDEQPIVALSTPSGSGALALIRLSGTGILGIADKFISLASSKSLPSVPTHTIHYGFIKNNEQEIIDRVMISIMQAPRTFTGEDTIEITCHNNPFIIEDIIQQALINGCRLAQEGEFTKRAVLNNKMDLLQAESIHDLITAHSKHALKQSLEQLDGSLSHWISQIEQQLLKCIAITEASFEFIDDEVEFDDQIKEMLNSIINTIKQAQKQHSLQEHIKDGIRISLIGSVNAGKSSLFNTLLNKDKAIVTNIAGTTRDAIEGSVYRDGFYCTFIDTAGLRRTDDIIEQEGINRSHKQAQLADLVLLVRDGSCALTNEEQTLYQQQIDTYKDRLVFIETKSDLSYVPSDLKLNNAPTIRISNSSKSNVSELEKMISLRIKAITSGLNTPFNLNKRQYNLLSNILSSLQKLAKSLEKHIDYELCAFHLKEALEHLSELSGKSITQQSMDTIFKEFCIGK